MHNMIDAYYGKLKVCERIILYASKLQIIGQKYFWTNFVGIFSQGLGKLFMRLALKFRLRNVLNLESR